MKPDDLRRVLTRYPAIVRPRAEPEPLGNAGGGSGARLWRFESGRGLLIARAWPIDGPGREALERTHRWLGAAAALGYIPVPLAALDGRTVQEHAGRLWEVAPWMSGRPAPAGDIVRLRAGFAALAAFHQCLARERARGPSPALRARIAEIEEWQRSGFATLRKVLDRSPEETCLPLAVRWLSAAEPAALRILERLRRAAARELFLQPCLRDARPEHFLFDGDRVTGLVDFGAMDVECVASDLARLLAEWVGPDKPARSQALEAYAAVRPLDESETVLIDEFASSAALLGAGHWIRWHFLEGRAFNDPSAVERGIARGLERLNRLALR